MSKRLVLFANNRVGVEGTRLLRAAGANIVGVVVHEPARAKHREAIIEAAGVETEHVLDAPSLRTPEGLERLRAWRPELGFSMLYADLLRDDCLALFADGVLNVHPSLLPWGRGEYPNVWAIVERSPAGASLHFIDRGIDTGDLVDQVEVRVESWDTGASLYGRLEEACLTLIERHAEGFVTGRFPRHAQPTGGSFHRRRDVEGIDRLDLDAPTTARAVIDLLRARTFPPYRGAYFVDDDGRRINLRLSLEPEPREESP